MSFSKLKICLAFTLLLGLKSSKILSQDRVEIYMPYSPATVQSMVPIHLDSYYFLGGHKLYSARFTYQYALPNKRHMMGLSVPVIHAIFNGDYAGFENTTGIGDIRFSYLAVPFIAKKNVLAFKQVATYLEVTTPTGNEQLGRGVGTWLYEPGIILTYQLEMFWYIFPEVRFQFSTSPANTYAGSEGLPDLEDPEADAKLQNLAISLPTTYVLDYWDGWVGLSVDYSFSYQENTYFIFLHTEVGKMISESTAASLELTRFVAGQPRLQTVFRAKINFFLK